MSRWLIKAGGVAIAASVVIYFFPLFHIERVGDHAAEHATLTGPPAEGEAGSKPANGRDLWDRALRAGEGATEALSLWRACEADFAKAKNDLGRQAGLGGAWYFYIRGEGTVVEATSDRCVLSVAGSPRRVCLELGPIVDSTVRDAVGISAGEFANSQDYNAVSSELNRRVEQDVIAPMGPRLALGVLVKFAGCAKIRGESDLDPLLLVPVRLDPSDDSSATPTSPSEVILREGP